MAYTSNINAKSDWLVVTIWSFGWQHRLHYVSKNVLNSSFHDFITGPSSLPTNGLIHFCHIPTWVWISPRWLNPFASSFPRIPKDRSPSWRLKVLSAWRSATANWVLQTLKPFAFLDAKRWVPKLTFEATRKSSRSKITYLMDTVIQSWIQPKMS